MTRLSDEALKALIDGCEGVTPGPWEGSGTLVGIYIEGRREWTLVAKTEKGREFPLEYRRNTSHIARCDPATIRALASEVLESREAMKGAAVVANYSGSLLREKHARISQLNAELDAALRVGSVDGLARQAAEARIAELEAALAKAKETADAEFTAKLRYRDERMAAEARIAKLEAALAKAMAGPGYGGIGRGW